MAQKTVKARTETKWWGAKDREKGRFSILELVKKGTLDLQTASILWLVVERKGSIIIASETPETGRTTLLSALLDLFPPSHTPLYIYGREPDLAALEETSPDNCYILAPEFGTRRAAYIWGKSISKIFKEVDKGYSLGTTLQADSPEEVFHFLRSKPISVSEKLFTNIDVIVNMRLAQGIRVIHRRVCQLTVTLPLTDKAKHRFTTLVGWEPDSDSHMHLRSSEALSTLALRLKMSENELEANLVSKRRRLNAWMDIGITKTGELSKALAKYYESRE